MKHDKIELIMVFKKEISLQDAELILNKTGVTYREGMDSSRGKIYFNGTGPKFILTFENGRKKNKFERVFHRLKEVYEIYTPDWDIRKD